MQRNLALDWLKLVLALMVVGLHSVFLRETSPQVSYWLSNSVFRMAVPIFLVINGYYFFSVVHQSPQAWFKRVLLLYVFWMLVYSYFWLGDWQWSVVGLAKQVKDVVLGYDHLWYLPAMLGAAAILYGVRGWSTGKLLFSALVLYTLGLVLQYAGNYHLASDGLLDRLLNTFWVYRNFLFFGFPFFTLGYVLRKLHLRHECGESIALFQMPLAALSMLTSVAWLCLLGEVVVNWYALPKAEGFDMLASLLWVCPLVFVLVCRCNVPGDSRQIANCATAIYFIHPLWIAFFTQFIPLGSLMTLWVTLGSLVSAYVLIQLQRYWRFIL